MRNIKEKGISLISVVLVVIIVFGTLFFLEAAKPIDDETESAYKNYYIEDTSDEENEASAYFYNQLSKPEKIMYATILANMETLKNGTEEINFSSDLSDSVKEIGGSAEDNYFQTAWDALCLDNMEIFYIETNNMSLITKTTTVLGFVLYEYTLEPKGEGTYYKSTFSSREQVDNAIAQIEEVADEIISNATGSRYDKVKYIHDWIVDNLEYDTEGAGNCDGIYGALVEKKAVCEGYAKAFKYLLDKLDIPCVVVYGMGYDSDGDSESHAWNYVKMEDGNWYAVDTTWDDPIYRGKGIISTSSYKYKYFLKGAESFNTSHESSGDVSGTGQKFTYPDLCQSDY